MPIGTTTTAILLNINKPTRIGKQQKNKSFWWEILEMIGVQVIAVALAPFTGGLSESIVLGLGASDFIASSIAFGVYAVTDFTINQVYDYLKGNITPLNTFLNLLPAFAGINKITRGYRTTKFIKLAKTTKTLEQIGIKETKNLQEIISQVSGKEILTDKIIGNKRHLFNYNFAPNRETIIQNLGFVAERQFKNNFQKLEAQELKDYLLLQNTLIKLSPQLIPRFKIKDIEKANIFLKKYNTDLKEVLKMNQHEWLNLVHTIHSENRYGKTLILDLQKIRANTIKFNFKNSTIHQLVLKTNQTFKYFDIKFYLKKGLNKFWKDTTYFEKLRESIYKLQEKFQQLEEKVIAKINKLKEKATDLFTTVEKRAIKHAQLIPLNSPVFMGCKIQPLSLDKCAISIYHRNPKYKPIVIIDNFIKAETFVTQIHPFHWYRWYSGWYIGYGVSHNKWLKAIAFAPPVVQQVIRDSFKIYREIFRTIRTYHRVINVINDPIENINKSFKNVGLKFSVNTLFGTGLLHHLEKFAYSQVVKKGKKKLQKEIIHISHKKTKTKTKHYKKAFFKEW
ncbi:MAG: hypothetical protein PPFGHCPK_01332 [Spiroplasma endosymbiont of Drosophila atripex]|nr:MAG: hypothetical protein PPFGHCPK_00024 [Spiroplasma endosymbiont of Drosophila atripex]WDA53877.1 MAG: hypothetical protein PPFGHCPK_00291 [Spiroplasma endosymbiont of Drosophila atripex]WDA54613.1 MAG: hypothetical protein PPFGHCPK_01069 [Spiroplasma endosymbiont of Drosophila atripex]WDA54851.1 MAG: hypothetical protein PPFGHCPK_01332 [Spiroplasma endosymbiont of Drosophila atripex]